MAPDQSKDWVSILKRNNALTLENIRRALKNCADEHQRVALQTELERLNAKMQHSRKEKPAQRSIAQAQDTHKPFTDHLPDRPYCTNDLGVGLSIRPTRTALTYRYLQYNTPGMVWTLAQDIDRPVDRDYFQKRRVPPPNRVVINQANGHGHALYFLSAGVCRASAAKLKPLRYLAAIEGSLCRQLEADPGFAGLITKNPLHDSWETWNLHDHRYSLGDLAEYLDLSAANAKAYRATVKEAHGLGRNVTMFDDGRIWAYRAIREHWAPNGLDRWAKVVLERLESINGQFQAPLSFSEVKATAKSISKWTWAHITPDGLQELIQRTHTSEVQAERGRRSGVVRRAGSITEAAPWERLNISRSTWYRQRSGLIVPEEQETVTHEPISDNSA
ncbi:protein of unknown function [Acidithiobacillus ferrivorans]|uniref:Primase C-terminal 1 domain-containing protein n=1 Tax=Acidithiobacillus ferrivorans TaxID=160808 RepID=A0A060UTS7_9PROT|nr:replication initiation protein [Acidithiobacillus ferrivorans]CDQ10203.1 hypothetical protein AFERRI_40155 [Acidithiobacillus ferrivorans]SMH64163.1 protein of unknown function [Acidithiobacillus ferrivorans]